MAQKTVSVTFDGETYSAIYELKQIVVTVTTEYGIRSAPVGNSPPDVVARMLLREMIQLEKLYQDPLI